ncbi:MAG: hydrogenase maturation protease [Bacteroidia bacterium]|nr:hydrogenase maturation protease [Bacteroidia bacterium]
MFSDIHALLRQEDKRILFVGIGNLLKSDDGVGVYISRNLRNREGISVLTVEVSIENYIGKINSLNPDYLVLIDCMDLKSKAGTYKLLDVNQVQDLTFNTHNISLKRLKEFFIMPVFILGIQPEKVDFGENLSYLVKGNADSIIKLINNRR